MNVCWDFYVCLFVCFPFSSRTFVGAVCTFPETHQCRPGSTKHVDSENREEKRWHHLGRVQYSIIFDMNTMFTKTTCIKTNCISHTSVIHSGLWIKSPNTFLFNNDNKELYLEQKKMFCCQLPRVAPVFSQFLFDEDTPTHRHSRPVLRPIILFSGCIVIFFPKYI